MPSSSVACALSRAGFNASRSDTALSYAAFASDTAAFGSSVPSACAAGATTQAVNVATAASAATHFPLVISTPFTPVRGGPGTVRFLHCRRRGHASRRGHATHSAGMTDSKEPSETGTTASETDDAKKKPYVPIADRPLLGVPEAEALTGVPAKIIRAQVRNGLLKARMAGSTTMRIRRADLDAWLDALPVWHA